MRLRAASGLLFLSLLTLAWPLGSQERRAVVWTRAQEAASGEYRTVTDASGLVEVDSEWPLEVDNTDLAAVCRAKSEALRRARVRAEQESRGGGIDEDPTTMARRSRAFLRLASIATFQGDLDAAIVHLTRARRDLTEFLADFPETKTLHQSLTESLGAAHMRRGEVQNCLLDPNAERCLFPVLAGGRHQQKAGVSAAATHFLEFLESDPGDLEVKWLLNVAHMLLGTYPASVPKEHLLGPELFASEHSLPQFVDVAGPAVLGQTDIAGGTITDDFDGDGLLDVFFTSVDKCTPARLYRNTGTGTFEVKADAGLDAQYGAINSIQADYDNDGLLDVYLLRGGWEFPIRNSLLRNLGGGRFEDVTAASGLIGGPHLSHSAAFLDYDLDGLVDLFVGHEMSKSQLFRNRGDGTFEDVTARAGVATLAHTMGGTYGDNDGDGETDT